ncbi:MAG: hypothetical protein ACOVRP_07540, partial [Gemmatimonas sp.]
GGGGLPWVCRTHTPGGGLARLDWGRPGRQGEPGTAEVWRALDAPAWQPDSGWAAAVDRWLHAAWRRDPAPGPGRSVGRLASRWFAWRQSRHDALQFRLRRAEIDQDLHWQHRTGRSPNHED